MAAPLRRLRHDVLYYSFLGTLRLGSQLPLPILRRVGSILGSAAITLARKDRRRALDHLAIAFPDRDDPWRRRVLRMSSRHFGLMLAEVVWISGVEPARLGSICTVTGLEHLEHAVAEAKGTVVMTAHCGNWELLGTYLATIGWSMTYPVRGIFDQRLDALATSLRTRFGAKVITRGPAAGRQIVETLAGNGICALLIDQDIRDLPGAFVPFFGRPAWTPIGAAMMAMRKGSPCLPAFIHRRTDGIHLIEIHPPLPPPTASRRADRITELTAAATAAIEAHIRRVPEQWVWHHRRWRTQPEDVAG